MASRDELLKLKASRKGFKSLTSRCKRVTLDAIDSYFEGDDPFYVESKIQSWEAKLNQYQSAEATIVCHCAADDNDMDKDLDSHEDAFNKASLKVRGFRQDFDRTTNSLLNGISNALPYPTSNSNLPKLNFKCPPMLEEDTNLRTFIQ
jgi:hypothetical protein